MWRLGGTKRSASARRPSGGGGVSRASLADAGASAARTAKTIRRELEGAKKGVGERKDAPVRGGTTRGRRGAPATYLDRDRQRERGLGLGLGLAILGRLALGGGGRLVAHRAMRSGASAGPRRAVNGRCETKKSKTHARRAPIAFASRMKISPANQRPAWASSQANRKAEPVKGDPRATSPVFKHPTTARRTPHRRQNGRCYQRLHRRARRRPQGASRFGVDRSRERRARVSGEDHANIASRSRACQHPNRASAERI